MNIDKCPRCGLRHSSEDCPSTMAAFHLSRMDPDYEPDAAPQAPSGQQAEPTDESLREDIKPIHSGVKRRLYTQAEMDVALAGQQSERPAPLLELLARIHRDGGHYVDAHGLDKAVADADAQIVRWLSMEDARPAPAGQVLKKGRLVISADRVPTLKIRFPTKQAAYDAYDLLAPYFDTTPDRGPDE